MSIAFVCRAWKRVVFTNGVFWTVLNIRALDNVSDASLTRVSTHVSSILDRSACRPLYLALHRPNDDLMTSPRIMDDVKVAMSRAAALLLVLSPDMPPPVSVLPLESPRLGRISLRLLSSNPDPEVEEYRVEYFAEFFDDLVTTQGSVVQYLEIDTQSHSLLSFLPSVVFIAPRLVSLTLCSTHLLSFACSLGAILPLCKSLEILRVKSHGGVTEDPYWEAICPTYPALPLAPCVIPTLRHVSWDLINEWDPLIVAPNIVQMAVDVDIDHRAYDPVFAPRLITPISGPLPNYSLLHVKIVCGPRKMGRSRAWGFLNDFPHIQTLRVQGANSDPLSGLLDYLAPWNREVQRLELICFEVRTCSEPLEDQRVPAWRIDRVIQYRPMLRVVYDEVSWCGRSADLDRQSELNRLSFELRQEDDGINPVWTTRAN
ncbi:hypothetical protein DL93DRAFT_2092354 [Clavulina sp. PMI_390]|nr:hypothetical protein DL93DRAFT_2092354 [Clavulina sp. PMI_390]